MLPFVLSGGDPMTARSKRGEENTERELSYRTPGFRSFGTVASLAKTPPACQDNSPQARIADSSSIEAISFSSARTTKRCPSSGCASAIQIDRPGAVALREAILVLGGVATTSKIAEMEIRAAENVIWSAEPRSELSCRFFIVLAIKHRWPCYRSRLCC